MSLPPSKAQRHLFSNLITIVQGIARAVATKHQDIMFVKSGQCLFIWKVLNQI
jgi:hypothetical protein